jgi:molybdopterin adenylyltransferase
MPQQDPLFTSLNIAVLTVSDTRNLETDTSGQHLAEALLAAGHGLAARALVPDCIYRIRAAVSTWIADTQTQVILITGGTGFAKRDSTPEAIEPLLDKTIPGWGEAFRAQSWQEIGASSLQSRALAGLANACLVVCLPGSTGACRTGWQLLAAQLDSRTRPCNFVPMLKPQPQP